MLVLDDLQVEVDQLKEGLWSRVVVATVVQQVDLVRNQDIVLRLGFSFRYLMCQNIFVWPLTFLVNLTSL